jgi:hypothetical protein
MAVSATAGECRPTNEAKRSVFTVLLDESRMNATEAAKLCGKNVATVIRWITRGVRRGGRIKRLEAYRNGGQWVTSREALARFMEAVTADRVGYEEGGPEDVPATPDDEARVVDRLAAQYGL